MAKGKRNVVRPAIVKADDKRIDSRITEVILPNGGTAYFTTSTLDAYNSLGTETSRIIFAKTFGLADPSRHPARGPQNYKGYSSSPGVGLRTIKGSRMKQAPPYRVL